MMRTINKMMAPVVRKVQLMVARGVLAIVDDATKLQGVQVKLLSGEVRTMERFQNYGFSSHPHPGAEVVAVFCGGNRDHGLAIAIDDRRYRIKNLQPGEVAISDDLGHEIRLTRTGISILGCNHPINITACPSVTVTNGDVIADGVSLKHHKHGGVQAGSSQTGGPV